MIILIVEIYMKIQYICVVECVECVVWWYVDNVDNVDVIDVVDSWWYDNDDGCWDMI